MKTLLDVHTHTIASGHAFSSLQEMTLTAKEKGLDILGITEHGPNIPGTCDPIYFRNLHCVPRQLYGIKLMLGAELNILNTMGDIDLDEDYWRMLDIRIAGIHSLCWQEEVRRRIRRVSSMPCAIPSCRLSLIPAMVRQN